MNDSKPEEYTEEDKKEEEEDEKDEEDDIQNQDQNQNHHIIDIDMMDIINIFGSYHFV